MVVPRESEWFGFFKSGQDKEVLPLEKTDLYLNVSFFLIARLVIS